MKGRATGSPELEKAAALHRRPVQVDGLKPLDGKSYLQAFESPPARSWAKDNRFEYTSPKASQSALQLQQDFVPFNFSAEASETGGWFSPDTASPRRNTTTTTTPGIDVKGKFVMVLAHEPQEFDEKSVFDGKVYTTTRSSTARRQRAKRTARRA